MMQRTFAATSRNASAKWMKSPCSLSDCMKSTIRLVILSLVGDWDQVSGDDAAGR